MEDLDSTTIKLIMALDEAISKSCVTINITTKIVDHMKSQAREILLLKERIAAAEGQSIKVPALTERLSSYDKGKVAGDTAFRIGGNRLYYNTINGIYKRKTIGLSPVDAAGELIEHTHNEYNYACGYIDGYGAAEYSCKQNRWNNPVSK